MLDDSLKKHYADPHDGKSKLVLGQKTLFSKSSDRCRDGTNDSSGVDDDSMHNNAGCSKSKMSKAEHEIPIGKDASE